MISAKAPQQTQEIGSKKVLGAYPAHTLKCFPGHFGAPPPTPDVDLDHFCIVLYKGRLKRKVLRPPFYKAIIKVGSRPFSYYFIEGQLKT